ncbi:MAG TPA: ATP-binding protein [Vicinamibacterales bacterium]|nr:ATP-binding protein [Vicinamibacterales bacterium]
MRTPSDPGGVAVEGPRHASITVPSRVESIRCAADFIIEVARTMRVPAADDSLFESAVVEALNNAIEHGNAAQHPDAMTACELEVDGRRLTVRIFGKGPPFALRPGPAPEWNAADLSSLPEGGLGIHIIRGVFPDVRTVTRGGEFGLEMVLTF